MEVRCTTANAVQMVFPGMGTKAQPRESRVLEYPKRVVQAYWNVSGVRLRVKSSKDGDLQSTKTTLTVTTVPGVGVAMGNGKCQRTVWTVTWC